MLGKWQSSPSSCCHSNTCVEDHKDGPPLQHINCEWDSILINRSSQRKGANTSLGTDLYEGECTDGRAWEVERAVSQIPRLDFPALCLLWNELTDCWSNQSRPCTDSLFSSLKTIERGCRWVSLVCFPASSFSESAGLDLISQFLGLLESRSKDMARAASRTGDIQEKVLVLSLALVRYWRAVKVVETSGRALWECTPMTACMELVECAVLSLTSTLCHA